MQRVERFAAAATFLVLLSAAATAQADLASIDIGSAESGHTQMPYGKTTVQTDSGSISVGRGFTSCWRFESAGVEKNAIIEEAFINLSCKNCYSRYIRARICGEYTVRPEPFAELPFNLSDRTWTRQCTSPTPDNGGSLAAERFDITPVLQELVGAQGWDKGNDLVVCFVDNGSRGYSVVSPAATLTATFSASGVEPSPDEGAVDCLFDTDGDGDIDKSYADTDGDGYCNFPAGSEYFLGTLVLDRPFEITGDATGGRGVDFHGKQIRLVAGGEVISDKQSPWVGTVDFPKGLDLTFAAESGLSLFDGLISNLGATEDEGGDIMLSTDFANGPIRISGPLILAEDLIVESNGAIGIEGQTIIGVQATVRLTALQSTTGHDISLTGQTEIYAAGGLGRIIFENKSVDGQVIIGEGVLLSAANIDFCDVKGGSDNIDSRGADIRGKILLPGTPNCE